MGERTFVLVNPHGVQRGQLGSIMTRFEQKGYRLQGMKLIMAPLELLQRHFVNLAKREKYADLLSYMTSGPVVAMIWTCFNVVNFALELLSAENIAQSSLSNEVAQLQIDLWFGQAE